MPFNGKDNLVMKLPFSHQGTNRTLNKHPEIQRGLKRGTLTEAEARFKPWYFRYTIEGKEHYFPLSHVDRDAIRGARDIINGHQSKPADFAAFLGARDAKRSVTLGQLAKDWTAAGLPDADGHPRPAKAQDELQPYLSAALKWWADQPIAAVTADQHLEFATWRRAQVKRAGQTGDRSVDLELSALSCLCQWAKTARRIEANPFEDRRRFHRAELVRHCHEFMPESDEAWHRILHWFFTVEYQPNPASRWNVEQITLRTRTVGAWLAFCGLTGLRPEEPRYLLATPALSALPGSPAQLKPGTVFPLRDGTVKMKVTRDKHGQNPYITLHPAALDFLAIWRNFLQTHFGLWTLDFGQSLPWFPNPTNPTQPICVGEFSLLNKRLDEASTACQLPGLKPKGFGRAFYVRVRRSQGADDATIAGELGQTTNGKLIRDTYGNPDDLIGGALFDWLPEQQDGQPAAPAWATLAVHQAPNIIAL